MVSYKDIAKTLENFDFISCEGISLWKSIIKALQQKIVNFNLQQTDKFCMETFISGIWNFFGHHILFLTKWINLLRVFFEKWHFKCHIWPYLKVDNCFVLICPKEYMIMNVVDCEINSLVFDMFRNFLRLFSSRYITNHYDV